MKISKLNGITDEMSDHFLNRTNMHINAVRENIEKLSSQNSDIASELLERGPLHDLSKWEEPERTPYIYVTWKYKCLADGISWTPPADIEMMMKEATKHHVRTNMHHPEYWDDGFEINDQDRDAVPDRPTDATKMDLISLAEMVCDWHAVGQEKGNSTKSWADMNVNKRWLFTDDQVNKIYGFICDLEVEFRPQNLF